MLAAVCSMAAACCSVREERSVLLCGDFAGATIDLFRPLTHGTDGILQRVLHGLQVARQAANFAASGHIVRHGEVAFGDIFNAFRGALQRG